MQHEQPSRIEEAIQHSKATYAIRSQTAKAIIIAPILIILLQSAALLYPAIRKWGLWMLQENHPVELLTFVIFLAGGALGIRLAIKTKKSGEPLIVYGFYSIFAAALIFIGIEEIAWGQWLLGFDTPEAYRQINQQQETTIHNLRGLQGHSELLRLTYGIGGLIGIYLAKFPIFQKIAAPALLLPWFIIISAHASIDTFNDVIPIEPQFDFFMQKTSELIELLIAISASLYLYLNTRAIHLHT